MTQRRRIPFILLAALAMVFALATSVLAAGELNIKCDDRTVDLENDDTFEVAVKSSGTSTYATGMVDVEFDSDVFELTNIKFNTSIAPNNATYLEKDKENAITDTTTAEQAYEFIQQAKSRTEGKPVVVTPGQFRVDFGDDLATQNFTANNDDVLFTLTFKINKATTKEGPFTITLDTVDASYLDAEGNLINAVNLEDGTVKNGTAAITVTVIGQGDNMPAYSLNDHTLDVSYFIPCKVGYIDEGKYVFIDATTTDGKHSYTIPNDVTAALVVVKGDTNGDGEITLSDSTRTKAAANNKVTLTDVAAFASDVNLDGEITLADSTRIKAVANNKTTLAW
ncbi:MAG: hypothetical protein E7576_03845 [Ruminococcaceae bacterium]|jgi:hypothetical protein|nr:hypothetical protein [Oscillospiraceae bacterium]